MQRSDSPNEASEPTTSAVADESSDASPLTNLAVIYRGYFKVIDEGHGECSFCKAKISRKQSNTTGMRRHLESRHKKEYERYEKEYEEDLAEKRIKMGEKRKSREGASDGTKQQKLDCSQGKIKLSLITNPAQQQEWDKALADYVCESHVSFSQVSSPAFRNVAQFIFLFYFLGVTIKQGYLLKNTKIFLNL